MQTIQTPNLLSDALERAYSHTILNASQPLSFKKGLRKIGRTLGRAARSTGRFVANVINAQAEARARDMRYTRSPW